MWRGLSIVGMVVASACSASPARTAVAVPLEIPEPPPRVAMDPVPAAEPPAEAVPVPASRPTAAIPPPAPPRSVAAAPAPSPPQTPPVQVIEPVTRTAAPPPDLLPAGPPGRKPTATQVREALTRAKQKLDAIDRRRLNAGRRADYDSARQFIATAEEAVKVNNLMLAESSAEKAETLADGLK